MKAISLLIMRIGTGLLLVLWGTIKLASPEAAIGVSDKYYDGLLSSEALQIPLGVAEVALGLFVVLGFFRALVYPVQAIVLFLGAAAIWPYLADPVGLYLMDRESANPLFFPSLTVFGAAMAEWAFKEYDTLSLDRLLRG